MEMVYLGSIHPSTSCHWVTRLEIIIFVYRFYPKNASILVSRKLIRLLKKKNISICQCVRSSRNKRNLFSSFISSIAFHYLLFYFHLFLFIFSIFCNSMLSSILFYLPFSALILYCYIILLYYITTTIILHYYYI